MNDGLPFSHNLEWMTATSIEAMNRYLDAEEAFYLYFTPTAPHSPSVENALVNFTVRDTPSGVLAEDPMSMMPARSTVLARGGGGRVRDDALGVSWIDDSLGALIKTLESKDALNDTLIIFTLDHGNLIYNVGKKH